VAPIAAGSFEVKLTPRPMDPPDPAAIGRMTIDKRFQGDLEATSQGEMLAAGTKIQGSAGYVAIERVTGTLGGRTGSFVLQHSGTANRGALGLTIHVVPDSGTEELTGLTGTMSIDPGGGKHTYRLDYSLPSP
jgi:hypothetical protein